MMKNRRTGSAFSPGVPTIRKQVQRMHLLMVGVALLFGSVSLLAMRMSQPQRGETAPDAIWLVLLLLSAMLLVVALLAWFLSRRLHAELESWQQKLSSENASLAHKALHDPLTGLPNRAAFEHQLTSLWQEPWCRERMVVLFIDGDRFKQINDRYGHAAGDWVLKETGRRLRARLRRDDLVARMGGDEFAVLLATVERPEQVARVAQDIITAMAQPIVLQDGARVVQSLSIGAAQGKDHSSVQALMAQADAAMYHVKASGGGWYLSPSCCATNAAPHRMVASRQA